MADDDRRRFLAAQSRCPLPLLEGPLPPAISALPGEYRVWSPSGGIDQLAHAAVVTNLRFIYRPATGTPIGVRLTNVVDIHWTQGDFDQAALTFLFADGTTHGPVSVLGAGRPLAKALMLIALSTRTPLDASHHESLAALRALRARHILDDVEFQSACRRLYAIPVAPAPR